MEHHDMAYHELFRERWIELFGDAPDWDYIPADTEEREGAAPAAEAAAEDEHHGKGAAIHEDANVNGGPDAHADTTVESADAHADTTIESAVNSNEVTGTGASGGVNGSELPKDVDHSSELAEKDRIIAELQQQVLNLQKSRDQTSNAGSPPASDLESPSVVAQDDCSQQALSGGKSHDQSNHAGLFPAVDLTDTNGLAEYDVGDNYENDLYFWTNDSDVSLDDLSPVQVKAAQSSLLPSSNTFKSRKTTQQAQSPSSGKGIKAHSSTKQHSPAHDRGLYDARFEPFQNASSSNMATVSMADLELPKSTSLILGSPFQSPTSDNQLSSSDSDSPGASSNDFFISPPNDLPMFSGGFSMTGIDDPFTYGSPPFPMSLNGSQQSRFGSQAPAFNTEFTFGQDLFSSPETQTQLVQESQTPSPAKKPRAKARPRTTSTPRKPRARKPASPPSDQATTRTPVKRRAGNTSEDTNTSPTKRARMPTTTGPLTPPPEAAHLLPRMPMGHVGQVWSEQIEDEQRVFNQAALIAVDPETRGRPLAELMHVRFDQLSPGEKARLLLPILNGLDPFEVDDTEDQTLRLSKELGIGLGAARERVACMKAQRKVMIEEAAQWEKVFANELR